MTTKAGTEQKKTTDETNLTEIKLEMKIQKMMTDTEANAMKEGRTENKAQTETTEGKGKENKVQWKKRDEETNKIEGGTENGLPRMKTDHVKVETTIGKEEKKVRKLM